MYPGVLQKVRILHLFSDWKWTGPAEPTVSMVEALVREGVDVTIAYRKTPIDFPERTVEKAVRDRGIPFLDTLRLNRYFKPRDWLFDLRALRSYVARNGVDLVHTNLSHDHFTALFSLAGQRNRPLIVRTDHKRDGLPGDPFMAWAMKRTDGLVTYSDRIMEQDRKNFAFPAHRTCVISPGVRLHEGELPDLRAELGIRAHERIIGVIGRLKPDRGYDVILKAVSLLKGRVQGVKLLIMGRSSQIEKSIMGPLRELGIEDDVILAGYRIDDYFAVINTFDVFVMMRAGSDGTARALREVVAMGKPAVVSDRGMLPDLVRHGESGFVVPPDPRDLAEKLEILLKDDGLRRRFGERGRGIAAHEWCFESQARSLKAFYERLLGQENGPTGQAPPRVSR